MVERKSKGSERPKKKSGKEMVNALMNEVIIYGGLPVRRADVYKDALKKTGSKKAADMFAFGQRTKLAPEGVKPVSFSFLESLDTGLSPTKGRVTYQKGNVLITEKPDDTKPIINKKKSLVTGKRGKGRVIELGGGIVREGNRRHIKLS